MKQSNLLRFLLVFSVGLFVGVAFFSSTSEKPSFIDLELEVARLRSELAEREGAALRVPGQPFMLISGKIFSSYPFSDKNQIAIYAGARAGVAVGMPVTIGGHTLIGRVRTVFDRVSIAETVFSPDFKVPVRVGDQGADGLLTGGRELQLKLVQKDNVIKPGDLVRAAGSDFPYGLIIGRIASVQSRQEEAFEEASVAVLYSLGALKEAEIVIDFPTKN